ncbi:leucine-rich PPR motif-containing protein, mitochondrial-like isoform X2 [Panulirus ornatus]|uniref:leucine-rich PPR motif-containing protein, mitochondrial-like isoform X2 n=1 Tax=Panulirus ornatus TaxID=150431 RepID=UPI003A8912BB
MKSVQMTPTNITYEAMINAYGISGQLSQMKQVFAQMKQSGVALPQNQLVSLLLRLVKHGQAGEQFENINYVLKLIEDNGGNVDLSRIVLQMIHFGHVREAVHLLPSFPHIRRNNHLYSNASIYIQEMVHAEVEPDLVVEMCKELRQQEINLFSLQVALECSLREKKEILAWTLLKAIKEDEIPLRQHYFWPLLHMNAVVNEPSKLLECVHKMTEMDESPDLETLKDHVIPGLMLSHPELTLKMLMHAGVTVTKAASPLLIVLIRNNMFDQAFEFVRKTKVPLSLHDLTATLASAWPAKPRIITSLLAVLIHKKRKNTADLQHAEEDWGGQFLLDMAASRAGLSVEQIRPLFKELWKNKIGISESSADLLMTRSNRSIQEAIRNNISIILDPKLGHPPKEQEYNILPHPKSMTVEELDGHIVELQAKGLNMRGTLRKLLLKHAARNETTRVLNLMRKAKDDGMGLSAGMMSSILMAYISNKNVDVAFEMYLSIQEEHPSFTLDCYKVIDLSTLCVENGRGQEAVALLQEYTSKEIKKTIDTKQIRRNCRNLLIAAATTCSYELTRKLFSILHSGGLVKPDNLTLGALVKCKLNSGDLTGAVEEVKMICKSYGHLPMKIEILIHLIHQFKDRSKRKDPVDVDSKESPSTPSDLLECIINLISQYHGSVQAHHDLLFACLEAGHPYDARNALQSMGKELDVNKLNRQVDRYSKMERDDVLLHLITASRGNTVIDRQKIFSSLLDVYYTQSAADKGLSLWTMMQEEDMSPSQPFLSTLASLLATNNMKIPFQT